MKSIRAKLTASVLAICLSGMVLVTIISYLIARNFIVNETLEKTNQLVARRAVEINAWLESKQMLLKTVGLDIITLHDVTAIEKILIEQQKTDDQIIALYVGFSDDTAIFSDGWIPTDDWKATERPWYKDAMSADHNAIYTEPYLDADTGRMVVTAAANLGKINGLDAVGAVDVYIDMLLETVAKVSADEGGYAFLVDEKGSIIVHPDAKYAPTKDGSVSMSEIESYKAVLAAGKDENVKIKDYDDVTRYIIPFGVESFGWTLYAAVPEAPILADTYTLLLWVIPVLVIMILISILFVWFEVNRIIVKPVTHLTEAAKSLANGDINFNLPPSNSKDEIGILGRCFGEVVTTLHTVIDDMGDMSKTHAAGDFDHRLDEDKFKGAFKEVVTGVNDMTFMYIDNFMELIKFLESIGKGNFDAHIRKYPGKQAVNNEIIETLRFNLKNINSEITTLSKKALHGELSVRADAKGFEGDWEVILTSLNAVMEAITIPIQEASAVLQEMAKGNLQTKMVGEYKGDFALIETSMNSTIDELSSYITEISDVLSKISKKDLSVEISKFYLGDFYEIKQSINSIIETLNHVIKEITVTTSHVNDGARQVSDSSGILAEGASEQASAVEQLNATITTISEQTQRTAQSSHEADELSVKSMQNASDGNEEMKHMLSAMDGIKEASNNIANIIKVIDDIAFQTNLLALNAAVEAARAGAYGKGFAVVAEEVRSLAARSQKAARETSEQIEDTISRINDGTQIAKTTSEALVKIVENVSSVSGIINTISIATRGQAESVEQVSMGIDQISSVVQNNSSISEENSAAAIELSAQSDTLNQLLGEFTLK